MHQSLARRICQWVFLAGCVLPTSAVLAVTVWWNLPSTESQQLDQLEHLLGVRITAQSTSTPKPRQFRLCDAVVADIETGQVLVSVGKIETRLAGERLEIAITGAEANKPADVWLQSIGQRLLSTDWPREIVMEVADSQWHDVPVAKLRVHLTSVTENGSVSSRRMTLKANAGAAGYVECQAVRDRDDIVPETHVTLTGKLQGKLSQSVSQQLFGDDLVADAIALELESLEYTGERITRAVGTCDTGAGHMTSDLARRLEQFIYMRPVTPLPAGDIAFDRVGFRFVLDHKGLTLWGDRPGLWKGVIVASNTGPVFLEPEPIELPLKFLAWFATPTTADAIPATAAAVEMARRLPLAPAANFRR